MRLVIAGALGLAASLGAAEASAQNIAIVLAPSEVLLNVQSEGVHRARPDVMSVTAGVVTTGTTARQALTANAELANRLIEAVRAQGIEARDVQTSQLSVNPRFDESERRAELENRRGRIIGYIARNSLELKLRDLGMAPQIMDALFAAGANEVNGPRFSLSDPAPALRLARRDAVKAALEEATTYAEALDMRVARVLRVSERGSFDEASGNAILVTGSRTSRTPIEPGEIETRTTVWIDYALVPR